MAEIPTIFIGPVVTIIIGIIIFAIYYSFKYEKEFTAEAKRIGFTTNQPKKLFSLRTKGHTPRSRAKNIYKKQISNGTWEIIQEVIQEGKHSRKQTVFLFKPKKTFNFEDFKVSNKFFISKIINNLRGTQFKSPFDYQYSIKQYNNNNHLFSDDIKYMLHQELNKYKFELKKNQFAFFKRNRQIKPINLEKEFNRINTVLEYFINKIK